MMSRRSALRIFHGRLMVELVFGVGLLGLCVLKSLEKAEVRNRTGKGDDICAR